MISVIISSVNPIYLEQVIKNVQETIGVDSEIIAFDNRDGKKGICEIYNEGIQKAKYDMLCFMHEDIRILTADWGQLVKKTFDKNPDYGLLGIAGSDYKSLAPSGWNGGGIDTDHANFIQNYKFQKKPPFKYYKNPRNCKLAEVACIDGVWFCVPKNIAESVLFDHDTFTGFHGYDLDFSMAVARHYKIGVVFDVLIDHFSEGNYDKTWMHETLKFHKKWHSHLPVNILPHSREQAIYAEKATFKHFIDRLVHFKLPMRVAFETLYRDNKFLRLDLALFLKMHYYIFVKYMAVK